jgi:hypothetical protein
MKIWKEFNSSHSSNFTIIGKFENPSDLKKAYEMIEDFTLGSWEERYPSLKEFNEHWSEHFHPDVKYLGIFDEEFMTGIADSPKFEKTNDTIRIGHFTTNNFGGIIKLMAFAGAGKIIVE